MITGILLTIYGLLLPIIYFYEDRQTKKEVFSEITIERLTKNNVELRELQETYKIYDKTLSREIIKRNPDYNIIHLTNLQKQTNFIIASMFPIFIFGKVFFYITDRF